MNPLELRVLAYAALALILVASGAFGGYKLTRLHYEEKLANEHASLSDALALAQSRALTIQNQREEAAAEAEKKYVDLKASSDALAAHLGDQLRQYTALHPKPLSCTPTAASGVDAAPAKPGLDSSLITAAQQAAAGCLNDAAQLAGLEAYVQSLKLRP